MGLEPRAILQRAFPGIRENEADQFLASGEVREFPEDTIICHEGCLESTFYILMQGEVEVSKAIESNEVRVLKHLGPGDFFGEMAIIHEAPRAATIRTIKPATVLEFHQEDFASLMENSRSMSMAMVREVSRRLRENDELAINELRAKNRELAEAYLQLEKLEKARHEFLTTIAHELRTPLMASSGFLQVIRMGNVQGEALNQALDTISRNIQEIITLTNDILFVQEMDLILPEFLPTDIGAVIAAAVERHRAQAAQNQVGLTLNLAPGLPKILADQKSLERAVTAILDNAIKFSPDGGDVLVEAWHNPNYPTGESTNQENAIKSEVFIRIRDHGVGIPPEAMPHIFERFFHMDKMENHLFRGAGLGLSIARQVIEQHHGKIEAASEVGKGSTFTIRLKG